PAIGSAGAVTFVTKCSDVRQPGAAAIVATTDDREEQLLETARRRTGLAVADAAIVELADRRHLRGRAGKERLVGEVYLVAGEALLTAGDAELGEELEDGVARDAAEHGRQRRGLGDAARDDEHVLAARLGHVAVHVEQQGLVVARAPDLVRGEDRVHVVAAGLGLGEQRVRVEALEGAGLHADAVPESLVAEICPPGPCGDGDAGGRTGGEPHLAVAEEGDGADVALAKAVGADRLEARLDQLLTRERHGQIEDVGGAVESVHVFAQAEDRRAAAVLGTEHLLRLIALQPESALEGTQERPRVAQRPRLSGVQEARGGERRERAARVAASHERMVVAMRQLERLRQELDVDEAAATRLDVRDRATPATPPPPDPP